MSEDEYLTIQSPTTALFRDRGSKFLSYTFPINSAEDWNRSLDEVKQEHPKARHFCYAYRIGIDQNNFRANDDGEPSGSAGRPILGQIDSFELTNVFVVVVRYFGGTKLGIPGLINAYKTATKLAFDEANIITKIVCDHFQLSFSYDLMSPVMNTLKKLNLDITKQEFTDQGYIDLALPKSKSEVLLKKVQAGILGYSLQRFEDEEASIPGLTITPK